MFGKIVQLSGIPLEDGFQVVYGIDFRCDGTVANNFATLSMATRTSRDFEPMYCTYMYNYTITDEHDGFKDILVYNPGGNGEEAYKYFTEEYLFVIIPFSSKIETTAKKIAGRYPTEAILEMHNGDIVKVQKGGANPETYMAVQAGNEMFLVKKNR